MYNIHPWTKSMSHVATKQCERETARYGILKTTRSAWQHVHALAMEMMAVGTWVHTRYKRYNGKTKAEAGGLIKPPVERSWKMKRGEENMKIESPRRPSAHVLGSTPNISIRGLTSESPNHALVAPTRHPLPIPLSEAKYSIRVVRSLGTLCFTTT